MYKRQLLLATVVGCVAVVLILYVVDFLIHKEDVPRGVSVSGIEIGGMARGEAISLLSQELDGVEDRTVEVHAGELDASFVPADAGITPDWRATVEGAGSRAFNPVVWLSSFWRSSEVPVAANVADTALQSEVDRVEGELTRQPSDGAVRLEDGAVAVDDPVNGQTIDRDDLEVEMLENWATSGNVQLDAEVTEPAIQQPAVDEAREVAERAVSGAVVAHGRSSVDGVIPVERMGEVVTFTPDGDALRTDVNTDAAQAILNETLGATEATRTNATVRLTSGGKEITPSTDGVTIDWEATMADFPTRVTGDGDREFDATYIDEPASFTTEQAQNATFDEVVGEFTTGGFTGASGQNIQRVAETVNGAFLAPGETFSLNGYTGPRGTAQGYVESGVILNGHADTAVGGGISQFATTLYNAAYFAGMTDVAHTPHSYYISRYPAGREATVYEGAIDLQFRNDSANPVIIQTEFTGSEITVRLVGVKTVNVESVNGGRWNTTQPQPMQVSGDSCTPSSGSQGFTTSDTRIIRDLAGNELSRETTTTVYDPQPIVTCTG